jgi:hypothetical protein
MSETNGTPSVWRYDGQSVVVTGCSSGIGEAVAREVAELGARVIGLDLGEPHIHVDRFIQVDIGDEGSVVAAAAAIDGPIDSLFNCAGISAALSAQKVMAVNFIGTRWLTELLIPTLADGGSVATVASTAAVAFDEDIPTYRSPAETATFSGYRMDAGACRAGRAFPLHGLEGCADHLLDDEVVRPRTARDPREHDRSRCDRYAVSRRHQEEDRDRSFERDPEAARATGEV